MTEPALRLDCLGLKCPLPVVHLARRIVEIEPGQVLEILADDPAAGPDIAAWCRMCGQEFLAADPPRYQVRRRSTEEPPAHGHSFSG